MREWYEEFKSEIEGIYTLQLCDIPAAFKEKCDEADDILKKVQAGYDHIDIPQEECKQYIPQRKQAILKTLSKLKLPQECERLDKTALAEYLATFPVSLQEEDEHGLALGKLILSKKLEVLLLVDFNQIFAELAQRSALPKTTIQARLEYRMTMLSEVLSKELLHYESLPSEIPNLEDYRRHQKTTIRRQREELKKTIEAERRLFTAYQKLEKSQKFVQAKHVLDWLSRGNSLIAYDLKKPPINDFLQEILMRIDRIQKQYDAHLIRAWRDYQYRAIETLVGMSFVKIKGDEKLSRQDRDSLWAILLKGLESVSKIAAGKEIESKKTIAFATEQDRKLEIACLSDFLKEVLEHQFKGLEKAIEYGVIVITQAYIDRWKEAVNKILLTKKYSLPADYSLFYSAKRRIEEMFDSVFAAMSAKDHKELKSYFALQKSWLEKQFNIIKIQFTGDRWEPGKTSQDTSDRDNFLETSGNFLKDLFDEQLLCFERSVREVIVQEASSASASGSAAEPLFTPRSPRRPLSLNFVDLKNLLASESEFDTPGTPRGPSPRVRRSGSSTSLGSPRGSLLASATTTSLSPASPRNPSPVASPRNSPGFAAGSGPANSSVLSVVGGIKRSASSPFFVAVSAAPNNGAASAANTANATAPDSVSIASGTPKRTSSMRVLDLLLAKKGHIIEEEVNKTQEERDPSPDDGLTSTTLK